MKRLITNLLIMLLAIVAVAQVPQKMNFQALVRDGSNELVRNKQVGITISVTNSSNAVFYSEQQTVTTDGNGVAIMVIGDGSPIKGSLSTIDWSNGLYYLQTSIDLGNGTTALSCISPLLSVPYAFYAEKAGDASVDLSDYVKKSDVNLNNYYSKSEVNALLATLEKKIENGGGALQEEDGVIKAAFSVSDSKQVYFSKGNLQYQASTDTWRFANEQYERQCALNENISSTYTGWIDLFGYGTSGWNSGAIAYQPYSVSTEASDYYPGGKWNDLTGEYANADWGVYNKISNGGNQAGMWRTLTYEEWTYLFKTRVDALKKYNRATVAGVPGCIILPDEWVQPVEVAEFSYNRAGGPLNSYSADDWKIMEAAGAVFLPYVGGRVGTQSSACDAGHYWSSTSSGIETGRCLYISNSLYSPSSNLGYNHGLSVRLVQDVE